jgi:serine/threonine-protein kinase
MDDDLFAASRVGTTLGHTWRLEKLLGVGGMAAVYEARHPSGERAAIKVLHRAVAQQPDLRARFEQEARAVNGFHHPGVVAIRDLGVADDGAPFLVMELLSGESLGERARRLGGLAQDEVLRLVDELLDVLAAAHARGIVHRDIKLDNLFVQTDGRLKVLDFGIARVRDGLPLNLRTRAGAQLGTAPYMPPEQILGQDIDARADLFAVGATMFRLLAGRRIHEAANETEMLLKMANEPAPPLLSVAPDLPSALGLVVDRALQRAREQRYPDALTMQADVRALRASQPPPYATALLLLADAPALTAAPPLPASTPSDVDPVTLTRPAPQQLGPERTLKSVQPLEGTPPPPAGPFPHAGPTALLTPPLPPVETAPLSTALSRGPQSTPAVSIVDPPPRKRGVVIAKKTLLAMLIGVIFLLLGIGLTLALGLGRG